MASSRELCKKAGLRCCGVGPGIFAESVSVSSTRTADVSDSAYFIQSIELRPTFDLSLGADGPSHPSGRIPSGKTLIAVWLCRSPQVSMSTVKEIGVNRQPKRAVPGCKRRRAQVRSASKRVPR